MGAERERNRIRSRVDELPEEVRQLLDARLADVRITYQEISEEITGMGHTISKSAVGRYAMRHNSAAKRLKDAQEQTAVLLQQVRENKDVETTELAMAILMQGLTQRIATAEDDYDALPIDKAGRLLVQIQRSAVYKERVLKAKAQARNDVENNIMRRIRAAVQDNPELLATLQAIVRQAVDEEAAKDATP